jgi:hypothetical protein
VICGLSADLENWEMKKAGVVRGHRPFSDAKKKKKNEEK